MQFGWLLANQTSWLILCTASGEPLSHSAHSVPVLVGRPQNVEILLVTLSTAVIDYFVWQTNSKEKEKAWKGSCE